MIDSEIVVALIAAVPATAAAVFAGVHARRTSKQTKPSNGHRLAETVEKTQRDVRMLKDDLGYHIVVQHGRGPVSDPKEGQE